MGRITSVHIPKHDLDACTMASIHYIERRPNWYEHVYCLINHYSITAGAYVLLVPTFLVEVFSVQLFASVIGLLYILRGFGISAGTSSHGILTRGSGSRATHSKLAFRNPSLVICVFLTGATFGCLWVPVGRFRAIRGPLGTIGADIRFAVLTVWILSGLLRYTGW